MKKFSLGLLCLCVIFLLALSACSQELTITLPPEENTPTPEPAPPEEEPEPVPSDTPETLEVSVADLLEAGTAMKWYDDGYLVFVPAGEVTLGDNQIENNQAYSVTLDDYWIYMFPVTNGQYSQCVATGACSAPASEEPYPDITDPTLKDDPVIGVTWDQAGAYCQWMKGRLPTKAEWEKAARGPQANTYPWGEVDPSCDLLNFDECEKLDVSVVYEYPEGRSYYQAFDLAGNTFEWVFDLYENDFVSQLPGEEPYSPPYGTERTVRGSSYVSEKEMLPAAELYYLEPDQYRTDLGFRCVIGEAQPDSFASPCIQTAFVDGLTAPWQPGPQGGNDLPDLEERTCVPEKDVNSTYYCANQALQQGGLDIYLTGMPGSEVYLKSWTSNPGVACVEGGNPIGCFGPEGASVSFEICASCTPLPNMATVKLTCDSGFTLTHTDPPTCVYDGQPVPGGTCPANFKYDPIEDICVKVGQDSNECPVGYEYSPDTDCCTATFAEPSPDSPGGSSSYLTCPPGYGNVQLDATDSNEGNWYATCHYLVFSTAVNESCEVMTFNLGECEDPPQKRCTNPASYKDKSSCEAAACKWMDLAGAPSKCVMPQ
jgi:hypothetical protein